MSYIYIYIYMYIYMKRLFLMFLDHTQRPSTVGRTPLDEWSARRRDLYLTTHDTHNRQISMPPVGFERTISAGERSQAAHLLRSWVRIPPGPWIFVCCECRVLSGRGLCDELITRPEESYRLCCVVVYDLVTSRMGAPYMYDISNLRVKNLLCRTCVSHPDLLLGAVSQWVVLAWRQQPAVRLRCHKWRHTNVKVKRLNFPVGRF